MADENANAQNTSDAAANNTGAGAAAGTQNANQNTAVTGSVSFTEEQQTALERIVARRLAAAKKSWAKASKPANDDAEDGDDGSDANGNEELETLRRENAQFKANQTQTARTQTVLAALGDRKLAVKNPATVERLLRDVLKFGSDNKPTNFDDAIKALKKDAPELFGSNLGSINAGEGGDASVGTDMNALIRQRANR